MGDIDLELSRISKLLLDRDQITPEEALARRQRYGISFKCGSDVADSSTLQLAVLTAAAIAIRCFPSAVHARLHPELARAPLRLWPSLSLTFGQALSQILGPQTLTPPADLPPGSQTILFGNAPPDVDALRVTYDGWIGAAGPASGLPRMSERNFCPPAGILAASLALSECFQAFAGLNITATRRCLALSLWRPDLPARDPDAVGIPIEAVPRDLWFLGLGHLGNAYLWTVGSLPYAKPDASRFFLLDYDAVEPENVETGLIFDPALIGHLKTRASASWLERRGFRTRLVERAFDRNFRRQPKEPPIALCGFDTNDARRDLSTALFPRVIESGLGASAANFDTIAFHTLPHARSPEQLWPVLTPEEKVRHAQRVEQLAKDNPAYAPLAYDECGRALLAGKAVGVPFVGTTAACMVVAEALRMLHDGPAYTSIKLSLSVPEAVHTTRLPNYRPEDLALLTYTPVIEGH